MRFRYTCFVRELVILTADNRPLTIRAGEGKATTVTLTPPPPEVADAAGGQKGCVCSGEKDVSLARPTRERISELLGNDGEVALHWFPAEMQGHLLDIQRELEYEMLHVVDLLRWQVPAGGRHDPFEHISFEFQAVDGVWRRLSQPVHIRHIFRLPIALDDAFERELQGLLDSGVRPPIGVSLLREARDLWPGNSRSALVLAVAAVEIGVKQCIAELSPDMGWLLENTQTAPLGDLVQHVLTPIVLARHDLAPYAPPENIHKVLREANQARNTLVHRPRRKADRSENQARRQLQFLVLEELLNTVADVLFLCDFYAGREWAINRVRSVTLQLMIDLGGGGPLPHLGV